jgi:hypothetical protein
MFTFCVERKRVLKYTGTGEKFSSSPECMKSRLIGNFRHCLLYQLALARIFGRVASRCITITSTDNFYPDAHERTTVLHLRSLLTGFSFYLSIYVHV